jgi:hypothetical protein
MTDTSANEAMEIDYSRRRFFDHGTQYYVATRLLFFAQGVPVTGTLAHHAIEMFLKGALCATVPLHVLASRQFGLPGSRPSPPDCGRNLP